MSLDPNKIRSILSKYILADGFDPIIDLDNSHGSYLVDQRNGDEYLDMFSMFASGAIGYNHPKIHAVKDKLAKASIHKPTLSDVYNTMFADFLIIFNKIAIPDYLKHAFFIEGGALAVENALKIAFDWKVRKNMEKGLSEMDTKIIHFKQAFHGRSGYTLSLTNTTDTRKTMYFPKFDWPRIVNPYLKFPITDNIIENVKAKEKKAIDQIHKALKKNPDDIAALIIEPIQGEGGDKHFRNDFFKELKSLSIEHDFLLIYDEVQTGIGITGKMWAHQHFSNCLPDIISFGKKTQVCGILVGDRINEVQNNVFKKSSRINSTFGGNLTDMMRFKIILEVIRDFNLLDNAKLMGKYLLNKLVELEEEFPAFIINARGSGLFCAFDLPSPTERDDLLTEMNRNNLLILSSGLNSIRFRPHLIIKKSEINFAIDIIKKSINNILK